MQIGNSGTIDEREFDKIDSELSYSPSLGTAVKLILRDPALVGERDTFSIKFIRVARFLKDNAPHVFQIRELGTKTKNSMDRWLWDLCWTRNIGTSLCLLSKGMCCNTSGLLAH